MLTVRNVQFWKQKGFSLEESLKKVHEIQSKSSIARTDKIKAQFFNGQKFGRWTISGPEFRKDKILKTKVICECSKEQWISTSNLIRGRSLSCRGCYFIGSKNNNWSGYKDMPGQVFHRIKSHAVERNIPINITKSEIYNLFETQHKKCKLSELDLTWETSSLDRIDSSLGYNLNNIQWVHKDVNYMKHTLPMERFLQLCKLISKNKKNLK